MFNFIKSRMDKKKKNGKKGFTLVELIVVLLILGILAAALVPALLGWIDKARNDSYVTQARNVLMAAQAVADEVYAANPNADLTALNSRLGDIEAIADVKDLTGSFTNNGATKSKLEITGADITFTDSKGKSVEAKLDAGVWKCGPKTTTSPTSPADPAETPAAGA